MLDRYQHFLVTERGLARDYADKARPFLAGRQRAGGLNLASLTAAEVTAFVLASCPGKPKGTAKLTVTALRSLLGFLHVEGLIREPLAEACLQWPAGGWPGCPKRWNLRR